jgi:hypothetical protein
VRRRHEAGGAETAAPAGQQCPAAAAVSLQ